MPYDSQCTGRSAQKRHRVQSNHPGLSLAQQEPPTGTESSHSLPGAPCQCLSPPSPYALTQGNSDQSLTLWFCSAPMQCPFPEADPAGCPVRGADALQSSTGSFCPLEAAGQKRVVHKMMLARCHLPQRCPAPAHP